MLRKGFGFLLPSGTLEKNRMISHDRKSNEWVIKFGGRGKLNINGQNDTKNGTVRTDNSSKWKTMFDDFIKKKV